MKMHKLVLRIGFTWWHCVYRLWISKFSWIFPTDLRIMSDNRTGKGSRVWNVGFLRLSFPHRNYKSKLTVERCQSSEVVIVTSRITQTFLRASRTRTHPF